MKKVLFVCLGNICRSPSGEAVFNSIVNDNGLQTNYEIDSAGTSAYHIGEDADSRMRSHGERRGYRFTSKARQITKSDLDYYDYVIAMDRENLKNIKDLSGGDYHNIYMMTDFSDKYNGMDVPDPYYGGEKGFETVLDIIEDSCIGLLEHSKPK